MKAMIAILFLFTAICFAQDDAVTVAEKKYETAIEQAKKEFVTILKVEQMRLTKAGDLDGAVKVRNRIDALELPDPNASNSKVVFSENMGYSIGYLKPGVSSHNNSKRPMVDIPNELIGLKFTQLRSERDGPVKVDAIGTTFIGIHKGQNYQPICDKAKNQGFSKTKMVLNNGIEDFEVWSVSLTIQKTFEFPNFVMIMSNELKSEHR